MANMNLITGYKGSNHVTSADAGAMNASIFGVGSYVINKWEALSASVINANTVRINDGDICMQGRYARIEKNAHVDISIDNGTSGYNRNDLIVARYTKNASSGVEEVNLVVVKGTPSTSSASDPEYTTGDIYGGATQCDMPLYRIPISGLTVGTPVPLYTVYNIAPKFVLNGTSLYITTD